MKVRLDFPDGSSGIIALPTALTLKPEAKEAPMEYEDGRLVWVRRTKSGVSARELD